MNIEQPSTGFNDLDLKQQQALIYVGAGRGIFKVPPYPVKFACRLETPGPATVTIQVSKDDGRTWATLGTFSLDTPGQWIATGAFVIDEPLVKAVQTPESIQQVSCVMGA